MGPHCHSLKLTLVMPEMMVKSEINVLSSFIGMFLKNFVGGGDSFFDCFKGSLLKKKFKLNLSFLN